MEQLELSNHDGRPTIDSRIVAQGLNIAHASLMKTIKTHQTTIESFFGRVGFEIAPLETNGGLQTMNVAHLTEPQVNFIVSLSRNTDEVVVFKARLVDAFRKAKELYNKVTTPQLPATYAQALRELAETVEAKALAEAKLLEAAPKIEFYDAVTDSKDAIPMGDVAKVLDMGIGRNKLFQLLRDVKVLMENNIPYQTYIDRGYFRTVERKWSDTNGETHIAITTLVFQRGVEYIRKKVSTQQAA